MITKENDVSSVVNITELVQLTNLGISITDITWSKVRLSSDQWICIRRQQQQQQLQNEKDYLKLNKQLSLDENDSDYIEKVCLPIKERVDRQSICTITLLNPYDNYIQSLQFNLLISRAQVNPVRPIIALSTSEQLFLFGFKDGRLLFDIILPEFVTFWSWINETTIGLICNDRVYHLQFNENNYTFKHVFNRDERLQNVQITNYEINKTNEWTALSSLYFDNDSNQVTGLVQIYSINQNQYNCIEAHCVKFTQYTFEGNLYDSNLLIAVKRVSNTHLKVFIIELGVPVDENHCITTKTELIIWSDNLIGKYDIPIAIICNNHAGFIYIFSKYGFLSVCDLVNGTNLIERLAICPDIIFTAQYDNENRGAIIIARNGQVLSVEINIENLIKYLIEVNKTVSVSRLKELLNDFDDQITRL